MVNDAESMRDADQKKKDGVEAKNSAESFINTVEKQMEDMKDKISTADKEDLVNKIKAVREALAEDDTEKIVSTKKELEQASWKASQQAYQGGGADSSSSDSSSSENKEGENKEEKK